MRVFITPVDRPVQERRNLVFSINMRSLDRDELDKQWFILSAPFPPQGYWILEEVTWDWRLKFKA
jgi:hypothetical protein